jgi:AraC-like DNA-binding protein
VGPGVLDRLVDIVLIQLLRRWLATSPELIALSVGYTSVYAFSRAFHRAKGQPPARFRHDSRQADTVAVVWPGNTVPQATG